MRPVYHRLVTLKTSAGTVSQRTELTHRQRQILSALDLPSRTRASARGRQPGAAFRHLASMASDACRGVSLMVAVAALGGEFGSRLEKWGRSGSGRVLDDGHGDMTHAVVLPVLFVVDHDPNSLRVLLSDLSRRLARMRAVRAGPPCLLVDVRRFAD